MATPSASAATNATTRSSTTNTASGTPTRVTRQPRAADHRRVEEMGTMNGNHLKYMLMGVAGVFGILLYAALLSCPLMMFIMGGGHAGHPPSMTKDPRRVAPVTGPNPSIGRASTGTTRDGGATTARFIRVLLFRPLNRN